MHRTWAGSPTPGLGPDRGLHRANLASVLFGLDRRHEALAEAREAIRLGEKTHWVFKELGLAP